MTDPHSPPAPPGHLSTRSRVLWTSIVDRYELNDEELATLTLALDALDRAHTARRMLRREGLVVRDRFDQPKPHPAASVARDAASTWDRLMRALGLPLDDEEPDAQERTMRGTFGRTPRGQGRVARAKAATCWPATAASRSLSRRPPRRSPTRSAPPTSPTRVPCSTRLWTFV